MGCKHVSFYFNTRPAGRRDGGRGNCRVSHHAFLNGRQIYSTWKKQLGRGLRQLQSGEINSRNETGKAQGGSQLRAGVQRLKCQKAAGLLGAAPAPDGPQVSPTPPPGPLAWLTFLWDSPWPARPQASRPEMSLGHRYLWLVHGITMNLRGAWRTGGGRHRSCDWQLGCGQTCLFAVLNASNVHGCGPPTQRKGNIRHPRKRRQHRHMVPCGWPLRT